MIEKMKTVCVVAQSSCREELLTALRDLGILHIAEKKSADPKFVERFALLSRMLLELKEYAAGDSKPATPLSDAESAVCAAEG